MFGDAAALAQPLEHLAQGRLAGEPILLEPPQRAKGGVVEFEPRVGPIDGDGGDDVLEHVGMSGDVAGELRLHVFEIGEVARIADDAVVAGERHLGELDETARAVDDDVMALRLGDAGDTRAFGERPAARRQHAAADLARLGDRRARRRIDRAGIGGVAVDEREIGGAAPHRQRQGVERGA